MLPLNGNARICQIYSAARIGILLCRMRAEVEKEGNSKGDGKRDFVEEIGEALFAKQMEDADDGRGCRSPAPRS